MSYHTNIPVETITAAANNATAQVLTEGTIITVNAIRFDTLRKAGLLAIIGEQDGNPYWGIEREYDDMITCVIADCSALE